MSYFVEGRQGGQIPRLHREPCLVVAQFQVCRVNMGCGCHLINQAPSAFLSCPSRGLHPVGYLCALPAPIWRRVSSRKSAARRRATRAVGQAWPQARARGWRTMPCGIPIRIIMFSIPERATV